MRTPRLDWRALRPMLENLKYGQGKSLNDVSKYLYETYGTTVTAARLSQIYKSFKEDVQEANAKEANGTFIGGI